MVNRWGNNGNSDRFYFLGLQNLQMVTPAMKLKRLAPWIKSYDKSRQCIKRQRHHLLVKVYIVKAVIFPEVMYACESWTRKKVEC